MLMVICRVKNMIGYPECAEQGGADTCPCTHAVTTAEGQVTATA